MIVVERRYEIDIIEIDTRGIDYDPKESTALDIAEFIELWEAAAGVEYTLFLDNLGGDVYRWTAPGDTHNPVEGTRVTFVLKECHTNVEEIAS